MFQPFAFSADKTEVVFNANALFSLIIATKIELALKKRKSAIFPAMGARKGFCSPNEEKSFLIEPVHAQSRAKRTREN